MSSRKRIQRKNPWQPTPAPDILQSRGLGNGKKIREPKLPTTSDILRTRPFAPRNQDTTPKDTRSLEEKMTGAEFRYNGVGIPAVQREEEVEENSQEQAEGETGAANISVFAPSTPPPLMQREEVGEEKTVMRQIQRQPSPAPAPGVFPPNPSAPPSQSEPGRIISNTHGLWMKEILERLSTLDKTLLENILNVLNIVGMVPAIDVSRFRTAVEAVLGRKFSQSSINWLDKNSSPGGFSDQVIEIRDFMKPDAFDRVASTLIAKVTQQIQQSYKKAIQDNQTNTKDAAKTTSAPVLPADAQQDLEKLKILSLLAATQLQAVINAQGDLSKSDPKAREAAAKAAGLNLQDPNQQEWCGAFAVSSYIPLQLSSQLKGVFWSTPKLLDFFTYQHGYDPYKWIKVDDKYPEVKAYHEQRGSLRKWLTGDQIHAGGELDIRPGDIVLQDNRDDSNADHIQMVQSWDSATQTLFTIDGNGGGYQVDNRPIEKAAKDKPRPDDEKRKAVEAATGYRLRPGGGGGVVGLGSYDLGAEPTEEQVKDVRKKGKKIVRIVGIGRPSLVDFEKQQYLTKLPPNAKKH